jgi:hypothetical protein
MRLLTNKTDSEISITYDNRTAIIPPLQSYDLSLTFKLFELAASDSLRVILAQGEDKYELSDGNVNFKAAEALELICGYSNAAKQANGVPIFAESPRDGSEWVIGSHNFCDPCSWFGDSVRVNNEVLTDSGDGYVFNSLHINWIDMTSGRMHNDDLWISIQKQLNPKDPHGYEVIVKVNDEIKTMCPEFSETGGDYWINYDDGKIIFLNNQSGNVITVSYNYATTNTFYVRPLPGSILAIEDAECDISVDTEMITEITYSAWHFDGEQFVKDQETKYKRSGQICTEARGCYPVFTSIGASNAHKQIVNIKEFRRKSRGMKYDRQATPFQYSTVKWLNSAYLQEVRVHTKDSTQFNGEHVSITFYCTVTFS